MAVVRANVERIAREQGQVGALPESPTLVDLERITEVPGCAAVGIVPAVAAQAKGWSFDSHKLGPMPRTQLSLILKPGFR